MTKKQAEIPLQIRVRLDLLALETPSNYCQCISGCPRLWATSSGTAGGMLDGQNVRVAEWLVQTKSVGWSVTQLSVSSQSHVTNCHQHRPNWINPLILLVDNINVSLIKLHTCACIVPFAFLSTFSVPALSPPRIQELVNWRAGELENWRADARHVYVHVRTHVLRFRIRFPPECDVFSNFVPSTGHDDTLQAVQQTHPPPFTPLAFSFLYFLDAPKAYYVYKHIVGHA